MRTLIALLALCSLASGQGYKYQVNLVPGGVEPREPSWTPKSSAEKRVAIKRRSSTGAPVNVYVIPGPMLPLRQRMPIPYVLEKSGLDNGTVGRK